MKEWSEVCEIIIEDFGERNCTDDLPSEMMVQGKDYLVVHHWEGQGFEASWNVSGELSSKKDLSSLYLEATEGIGSGGDGWEITLYDRKGVYRLESSLEWSDKCNHYHFQVEVKREHKY